MLSVSRGQIEAAPEPAHYGHRVGAVRKRSPLETKIEGEKQFTKRGKRTGELMDNKQSEKFKGVRKEH